MHQTSIQRMLQLQDYLREVLRPSREIRAPAGDQHPPRENNWLPDAVHFTFAIYPKAQSLQASRTRVDSIGE